MQKSITTTRVLILAFINLIIFNLNGQKCHDKIETARLQYESGQLSQSLHTLAECIKSDDQEIRFSALRLSTLNHLGLNQKDSARSLAIEMLKIHPDYHPSPLSNSLELIKLLKSITVIPKFSLGASFGVGTNFTLPRIGTQYAILNNTNKIYSGKSGFNLNLSSNYQFSNTWGANLEISIISKHYSIDYSNPDYELKFEEKLRYGNLSLGLRYIPINKNRLRPYFQGGFYAGRLLESLANHASTSIQLDEKFTLDNVSSKERRNPWDYGLTASAGLVYRLKEGQITLNMSYLHSMQNITDNETRFNYPKLKNNYFYLEDDLKLSSVIVSLGYSVFLNYKVIEN